jgi:hypothetical protein
MSITSKVLLAIGASSPIGNQRQTDQLRGPEPGATLVLPWGNYVIARWGNYVIGTPLKWGITRSLTGAVVIDRMVFGGGRPATVWGVIAPALAWACLFLPSTRTFVAGR